MQIAAPYKKTAIRAMTILGTVVSILTNKFTFNANCHRGKN